MKVVRSLNAPDTPEAAKRRLICKLHLRWWHCSCATMQKLLRRAGGSQEIQDIIAEVVDTCDVCRTWARPSPDAIGSTSLPEQFNLQVEADLMFYKNHIILHCICRCTRWHAAIEVKDKETNTLAEGLEACWLSIHGPMKELILNGEQAVSSIKNAYWLSRRGVKLTVRGVGQHARYIERRGALLRAG